jgi:hypothetical protein
MTSLEGWSSAIELRPQRPHRTQRPTPVAYRLQPASSSPEPPTSPTAHGAITIRPIPPPAIVIPLPAVFVAVTIGVTTPSRGWLPLRDRT